MIDFTNPYRPDIEMVIFKDQTSVDKMFKNMDDVLMSIAEGLEPELLEINKAYLQQCLSYEAIQQDDRSLTKYIAVL